MGGGGARGKDAMYRSSNLDSRLMTEEEKERDDGVDRTEGKMYAAEETRDRTCTNSEDCIFKAQE